MAISRYDQSNVFHGARIEARGKGRSIPPRRGRGGRKRKAYKTATSALLCFRPDAKKKRTGGVSLAMVLERREARAAASTCRLDAGGEGRREKPVERAEFFLGVKKEKRGGGKKKNPYFKVCLGATGKRGCVFFPQKIPAPRGEKRIKKRGAQAEAASRACYHICFSLDAVERQRGAWSLLVRRTLSADGQEKKKKKRKGASARAALRNARAREPDTIVEKEKKVKEIDRVGSSRHARVRYLRQAR